MGMDTDFSLFIIESLDLEDEEGRREGRILRDILGMSNPGLSVQYFYLRTEKEFSVALERFSASGSRYLHISCHGNKRTVALTLDAMNFARFGDHVRPHLKNRRLFMSACAVVNDDLASEVMPSGCYSLIGPNRKINFDDAVLMWATFYHLMVRAPGANKMRNDQIRDALRRAWQTFGERFTYFRKDGVGHSRVEYAAGSD